MKNTFRSSLLTKAVVTTAVLTIGLSGTAAEPGLAVPFESESALPAGNRIDQLVFATLQERGIEPALLCSDTVFVRRAYLDVIGTIPTVEETRAFLKNTRAGKRADLIESLLQRDEFAQYWALKWCDLLRVKAEFPINLWPNAVQAYHRWILDSLRQNKPYDQFARELLTSSGSNFRTPPVNFYRAIQGQEPAAIAAAVALTFMGVRLEKWPAERRDQLTAFFTRVAYKATAEWKEQIVYLDPSPSPVLNVVFPDGSKTEIADGQDPRKVFADWLIKPNNAWFARNIVNRQWSWLMGRGIVHEADDIRPDNPPTHPLLLAHLEAELVKSGYDLRQIFRLILNSRVYQQSSIPRSDHPQAQDMFATYPVRRLEAEVLIDALDTIYGGEGEHYSSAIPEPFSFIPEEHRSIDLADGSITSQFLEMFGRPARDTGLESERNNTPSDAQRLHMLNSTHLQRKIERSPKFRRYRKLADQNPKQFIESLYLNILSRYPTADEVITAEYYYWTERLNRKQWGDDLAWALTNTKEFLYRH